MIYKLFIADRSPSIQKIIKLAFPESEFEIFPFEESSDVLKNLTKIHPDAILFSLSFPGKDVYEVGFYLRSHKEFRNTSVFFLQGAFEPLDHQKIASMDYEEIIKKPFDSEKLARQVKAVIEKKRHPSSLPEDPSMGYILPEDDMEGRKENISQEEVEEEIIQTVKPIENDLAEKTKGQILKEVKESFQKEIDELKIKISKLEKQNKNEDRG